MQNHPVVEAALALQAVISTWSRAIGKPRLDAVEAAHVELDQARKDLSKLRTELDRQRRDMVLEDIPRQALRVTRGKIHDAETLIGDLEAGIREAEQQCAIKAGVAAIEGARNLIRATVGIRSGRTTVLSKAEQGGDPAREARQVFAEIRAARGWIDEVAAEVLRHGEVPEEIEAAVALARAELDTVAAEVLPYDTLSSQRKAA